MICKPCGEGDHKDCAKRNVSKQGLDCDCQHRARRQAPATEELADVQPVVE